MNKIKAFLTSLSVSLVENLMRLFGVTNFYRQALLSAAAEIRQLRGEVKRKEKTLLAFDKGPALDVRSSLSLINLDALNGDILWFKASDPRLLRQATFQQIVDYLKANNKPNSLIILTGPEVELTTMSDFDLSKIGLKRVSLNELQ